MDAPLRRNSFALAITALALIAPGAMRAQLSCSTQVKAFGPYLLFQVNVSGYRFTEIPLDPNHYIILQYDVSTGLPEVSELCLDSSQSVQAAEPMQMETARLASGNNATGSAAQNVAAGDFNGDGIVDAVVTALITMYRCISPIAITV